MENKKEREEILELTEDMVVKDSKGKKGNKNKKKKKGVIENGK